VLTNKKKKNMKQQKGQNKIREILEEKNFLLKVDETEVLPPTDK
jgi:hypothetical protein